MKIGVFGDSFASDLPEFTASWIQVLKSKGYDVTAHGAPSTSSWFSYTRFLEHYYNYTHIIFMYSHANRLSTISPELISRIGCGFSADQLIDANRFYSNLDKKTREDVMSLAKANDVINEYGVADQLKHFIQQSIFKEVTSICADNNIKLINVALFQCSMHDPSILDPEKFNATFMYNLITVSLKEVLTACKTIEAQQQFFDNETRACHLTDRNNIVLAGLFENALINYDTKLIVNLAEHDGFVYG
jgi:hypothetical protein